MHEEERKKSTENVYKALKKGGIFISFENVIPEDELVKSNDATFSKIWLTWYTLAWQKPPIYA